jgi:hypothetical protein
MLSHASSPASIDSLNVTTVPLGRSRLQLHLLQDHKSRIVGVVALQISTGIDPHSAFNSRP